MVSSKTSSTIPLDEQVLTTASYMAAMYYNALPLLLRLPPSSPYYASYLKLRETFEFQPKRSSENIHVLFQFYNSFDDVFLWIQYEYLGSFLFCTRTILEKVGSVENTSVLTSTYKILYTVIFWAYCIKELAQSPVDYALFFKNTSIPSYEHLNQMYEELCYSILKSIGPMKNIKSAVYFILVLECVESVEVFGSMLY